MHFSNEQEIYNLEFKGKGTFGAVYLKGDTIIKKYHDNIQASSMDYSIEYKNPCLRFRGKKFALLLLRNQFVNYTNLINDVVFVQNRFVGVSYPYVDGDKLEECIGENILKKGNICYQLIRNANELTDFFIYPLDYKINNIMYDKDGNVQIIDLDDQFTKVTFMSNPLYLYRSLYSLRRVVINFLENDEIYNYFDYYDAKINLGKHQYALQLKRNLLLDYYKLIEYVILRCQSFSCSFVDCTNVERMDDIDFSLLNKIQEFTFSKLILCISGNKCSSLHIYEYKKDIVQVFRKHLSDIYDIVVVADKTLEEAIGDYLEKNNINNFLTFRCPLYNNDIDIDSCINYFNKNKSMSKRLIKE